MVHERAQRAASADAQMSEEEVDIWMTALDEANLP
jgi:hypothetical protein